jgi:hypothetical protein
MVVRLAIFDNGTYELEHSPGKRFKFLASEIHKFLPPLEKKLVRFNKR